MKAKHPAATEPLPARITIATTHPFKFLDDVCAAYAQGYRVDWRGYLVMNVASSGFMCEMELIPGAAA